MSTAVLRRTVSGLFMVGIPGPTLDAATRAFLDEHPVGGVILFKRNVASAAQLRALTDDIRATGAGVRPLVGLDHEGGRVHRLGAPFTHFPAMAAVGASGDAQLARAVGRAMGRELAAIGVDVPFAPVLDVWSNPVNAVIGDRAFGRSPLEVVRTALPFAHGLRAAGVVPVGKHFPGHGDTVGDSHHVLPRVRHDVARLRRVELRPFVAAIRDGFPALMTSHVVYPALDRSRPATLSPAIATDLLRRRLRFRGCLFSDDLEMRAIAGRHAPERFAPMALAAGCDLLLVCQSLEVAARAMAGVEEAVARGRVNGERVAEALSRIQALRRLVRAPAAPPPADGWPAHARLAARVARFASSAVDR
jgi:beta-N-acetylhexosaminidase